MCYAAFPLELRFAARIPLSVRGVIAAVVVEAVAEDVGVGLQEVSTVFQYPDCRFVLGLTLKLPIYARYGLSEPTRRPHPAHLPQIGLRRRISSRTSSSVIRRFFALQRDVSTPCLFVLRVSSQQRLIARLRDLALEGAIRERSTGTHVCQFRRIVCMGLRNN